MFFLLVYPKAFCSIGPKLMWQGYSTLPQAEAAKEHIKYIEPAVNVEIWHGSVEHLTVNKVAL